MEDDDVPLQTGLERLKEVVLPRHESSDSAEVVIVSVLTKGQSRHMAAVNALALDGQDEGGRLMLAMLNVRAALWDVLRIWD